MNKKKYFGAQFKRFFAFYISLQNVACSRLSDSGDEESERPREGSLGESLGLLYKVENTRP